MTDRDIQALIRAARKDRVALNALADLLEERGHDDDAAQMRRTLRLLSVVERAEEAGRTFYPPALCRRTSRRLRVARVGECAVAWTPCEIEFTTVLRGTVVVRRATISHRRTDREEQLIRVAHALAQGCA